MPHQTLRKWSMVFGRWGVVVGLLIAIGGLGSPSAPMIAVGVGIACVSAYFLVYGQIGSF